MRIFLAQSFPNGWGGARRTIESMRLYLATWPPEKQREQVIGQASAIKESVKLHLADTDPKHHAWAKRGVEQQGLHLRILLSYWYYKDSDLDALFERYFTKPYPDVFADSGAFSADSQGAVIDWRAYAGWIQRWKHLFCTYANLDVMGNPAATAENQANLEGLGLSPLPVFHTKSPWVVLEKLIERYPYIALGGMVPYMRYPKVIMPWLIQCFKRAEGRAVFHGFGATSWEVLSALPWYSVDSSSWGQGFRFGQVPLFDEQQGRFVKIDLGDGAMWQKHAKLVRRLGFDPLDFADRQRNDRAKICAISALSYMLAERWLRGRWGEIVIPGGQGAPVDLRAHLVTAADGDGKTDVRGGNMSVASLAQAGLGGPRLHLSDTSNGVNFGDADKGLRLYGAVTRSCARTQADMSITSLGTCGLNLYLAGGVGDTSRAMEVLNK